MENHQTVGTDTIKQITVTLKELFPYGHPEFIPLLMQVMQLHSDKNFDYAGGGDPLGNFDRVADFFGMYPNFPTDKSEAIPIINAQKQIDCICWSICQHKDPKVEKLSRRSMDVVVYYLILTIKLMAIEQGIVKAKPVTTAALAGYPWPELSLAERFEKLNQAHMELITQVSNVK